jgi:hypothetical protein
MRVKIVVQGTAFLVVGHRLEKVYARESTCAGVNSFLNASRKSSQSKNFG